jgi:hypothetical protein
VIIKEIKILMDNPTAMENTPGRMDLIMKDSGEKGKEMVKEHYS